MSYTVTCYCNDETIKTTSVYISSAGITRTGTYGDSSLGDWEEFTVTGLNDAWTARFTAVPASGCSFSYWAYRIGDADANLQYSYDETFVYSGGNDIHIRAVGTVDEGGGGDDGGDDGGETEGLWTCEKEALGIITNEFSISSLTTQEYHIYRFAVEFESSGTARFGTTGNVDTRGYLSTTTDWETGQSKNTCRPTEELAYDDESGELPNNFEISYDVKEGTKYYLWVRGYYYDDVGSIGVYIVPPDASQNVVDEWDWYSSNGSANATETAKAHTAVLNKGYTKNFSYKVWNDMVDKVKELTDNSINYWDTGDYASYANTRMTSSGQTLTAKMFNSLRNNLELVGQSLGLGRFSNGYTSGKIPLPVYSYDDETVKDINLKTVYGHYFITLTNYINDCIRYL